MIPAVGNHLWQSTLFAAAAGLFTLLLRRNSARARHAVWLAASGKFLIPFALLTALGSHIGWRAPARPVPLQVWLVSQPLTVAPNVPANFPKRTHSRVDWPVVPVSIAWALGFGFVLLRWRTRWLKIREARRGASPVGMRAGVPIFASFMLLEPGVFGIFRPVLLLPEGITGRLTPEQLEAILAHELSHVRSRDNLAAAIHMIVEAVFWFYPLVWWLGARLVAERERACDEAVCAQGCRPAVYAEAILDICKYYLESPLACAAGVTGADLKKRIEQIMLDRVACKLDFGKKLLLGFASVGAIALPLGIGMLSAASSRVQSPAEPKIAMASVKPSKSPYTRVSSLSEGRIIADAPVRFLMVNAYGVPSYRILGGPAWVDTERYNIEATPEADPGPRRRVRLLQPVLEDRFQLRSHRETRDLPLYTLAPARSGLKLPLPESSCVPLKADGTVPLPPPSGQLGGPARGPCGLSWVRVSPTGVRISGNQVPMGELTRVLSLVMGRNVVDKTGFRGTFDLDLRFVPDQAAAGVLPLPGAPTAPATTRGPTVFTALEEQLGLDLDSGRGPVEVMVIDHIEKPYKN